MRIIPKLVVSVMVGAAILSAPAQACMGPQFERHIILGALPADTRDAEFVGHVIVREKRKWIFFSKSDTEGFLARVTESTTHPDLVGSSIELPPILSTSCGPWLDGGDRGFITGTFAESNSARPTLFPDSHKGLIAFAPADPLPLNGTK